MNNIPRLTVEASIINRNLNRGNTCPGIDIWHRQEIILYILLKIVLYSLFVHILNIIQYGVTQISPNFTNNCQHMIIDILCLWRCHDIGNQLSYFWLSLSIK